MSSASYSATTSFLTGGVVELHLLQAEAGDHLGAVAVARASFRRR